MKRDVFHFKIVPSAATLSCWWNQSLVSGKLQCRSTNNTSASDIRAYYAADNKISQPPLCGLGALLLGKYSFQLFDKLLNCFGWMFKML